MGLAADCDDFDSSRQRSELICNISFYYALPGRDLVAGAQRFPSRPFNISKRIHESRIA
jgi:hypothetical protein